MQLTVQLTPSALSELVSLHRVEIDRSRPSFIEANPHLRHFYRDIQCEMFGACRAAGLDTLDQGAMVAAINATLGTAISSRTQLTPVEMLTFTIAVNRGLWRPGWRMRLS